MRGGGVQQTEALQLTVLLRASSFGCLLSCEVQYPVVHGQFGQDMAAHQLIFARRSQGTLIFDQQNTGDCRRLVAFCLRLRTWWRRRRTTASCASCRSPSRLAFGGAACAQVRSVGSNRVRVRLFVEKTPRKLVASFGFPIKQHQPTKG